VTARDAVAEERYVTDQVTASCHTNEINIFVREEEVGGKGGLKFECPFGNTKRPDNYTWWYLLIPHGIRRYKPRKKNSNDDPTYRRVGERLTTTLFLIQSFWYLLINLITNLISLCS
jgi:hypothetical protein